MSNRTRTTIQTMIYRASQSTPTSAFIKTYFHESGDKRFLYNMIFVSFNSNIQWPKKNKRQRLNDDRPKATQKSND
jgi:hypothetical protein